MISLVTVAKGQEMLVKNMRSRRVQMGFTQAGLAKRAGVRLPTLRKFEQKGMISLESFLKLAMVLGVLEGLINATEQKQQCFSSVDDVLKAVQEDKKKKASRKRGWRE